MGTPRDGLVAYHFLLLTPGMTEPSGPPHRICAVERTGSEQPRLFPVGRWRTGANPLAARAWELWVETNTRVDPLVPATRHHRGTGGHDSQVRQLEVVQCIAAWDDPPAMPPDFLPRPAYTGGGAVRGTGPHGSSCA